MTHIKFMRCYLKVPKILMPQLSRLPKFLFTPFPSEVVPFGTDTAIPAGFAWSEHCCKSFRVWVFITFCDSVRISSMLLTRRPLSLNFNFGNRKKNHRGRSAVSRESCGMTVVFVGAKNCHKMSDAWTGFFFFVHDAGSRSYCATCLDVCAECFPNSRLRISQQNFRTCF